MIEIEEDDDFMIIEEEEMNVRENGEEDGDENAGLAFREIELEVCTSGSLVDSSDDAGNAKDDTPPTEVEVEEVQAIPSQESTPCISSPAATPPRKAPPVKHSPSTLKHPSSDDAIAISSPVSSAHADAGWEAESISSPPPTIPQPLPNPRARPLAQVVASTSAAIKIEKPQPVKKQPTEVIQLSSDPIDNYSSDAQPGESTPRPPPFPIKSESQANRISSQDRKPHINHKQTKPLTSTSSRASIQVRPDSNTTRSKEKKRVVEVEDDDEEDEAAKSVAASWRAKFMLQNSSRVRSSFSLSRSLDSLLTFSDVAASSTENKRSTCHCRGSISTSCRQNRFETYLLSCSQIISRSFRLYLSSHSSLATFH